MENQKRKGSELQCLMVKNIDDSHKTISNIFGLYLRDICTDDRFARDAPTWSIF